MDRASEQNLISSGPATIAVSVLEDDDFESVTTASNAPATQLPLDLGSGDTGAIFKSESTSISTFRYAPPPRALPLPLQCFIKPVSAWDVRLVLLNAALDRFDAGLLTSFDKADTDGDEARITEVAAASWHVCLSLYLHDGGSRVSGAGSGEWGSWWK